MPAPHPRPPYNPQRPAPRAGGAPARPGAADAAALQAISAPYNFVPLNEHIFLPDWAQAVSHDWPFQDGLSGELHYTLVADTPLLVGGRQTKPANGQPGEVRPFQLPDGRYAIPGSSLKGMLRSVLEIAAFGRMSKVDEVRPGLRDISRADSVYANRIRGKVQTGFLRRREDGDQEIVPCAMVRLNHRDLEAALGVQAPIFAARLSVHDKYARWVELCTARKLDPRHIAFEPGHPDATRLFTGRLQGVPVFTGQISDSTRPAGKHRDFLFFDPQPQRAFEVPASAWRDFLRIHGDEDGKPAMSWPGYWRAKYREHEQVPVFYLRDGDQLRIGLAYMPKLAGDHSTHDLIRHTHPGHLYAPGHAHGYDLADLLFGAINGERQADALRGRVSCETALALGTPQPEAPQTAILNGPKPSYFPNYLSQPADPRNWQLRPGQPYTTYIASSGSRAPTLRGFKRYPVRPLRDVKLQPLTRDQQTNTRVQVQLHPLPAKTRFQGRIVFHNLKPVELGALLWALTWGNDPTLRHSLGMDDDDDSHLGDVGGNDPTLRHSLGMGKPFGYGQLHIELELPRCTLVPNQPSESEIALTPAKIADYVLSFEEQMNAAIPGWKTSPQRLNLLAMADPTAANDLPAGMALRHMALGMGGANEFVRAKQARLVLADYAVATRRLDPANYRPAQGRPAPAPASAAAPHPNNPATPQAPAAPSQARQETWEDVTLTWNKGSQTLRATSASGKAEARGPAAIDLLAPLPADQRTRLEKRGELKGAQATVEILGNARSLKALSIPPAT